MTGDKRWSKARIEGLFTVPNFVVPLLLSGALWWLLLELGAHPVVAALGAVVHLGLGWAASYGTLMAVTLSLPGLTDPPRSAVLYVLGRAFRLLVQVVVAPVVMPVVLVVGLVGRVVTSRR
ncbi:hypothetical protein FKR81_38690 [Lentzea tibetensis]|uniref:Uncharacterized protein n=1 Tax=Lentzea tibetensis TaxID=2591470 RepID=A0A563EH82_9PSEU|nr:hypothetical protein [Lentzea tibetensis]TWP45759.1 hypothetical protein FKR81_38690 [Lentzea tibetensis]